MESRIANEMLGLTNVTLDDICEVINPTETEVTDKIYLIR